MLANGVPGAQPHSKSPQCGWLLAPAVALALKLEQECKLITERDTTVGYTNSLASWLAGWGVGGMVEQAHWERPKTRHGNHIEGSCHHSLQLAKNDPYEGARWHVQVSLFSLCAALRRDHLKSIPFSGVSGQSFKQYTSRGAHLMALETSKEHLYRILHIHLIFNWRSRRGTLPAHARKRTALPFDAHALHKSEDATLLAHAATGHSVSSDFLKWSTKIESIYLYGSEPSLAVCFSFIYAYKEKEPGELRV